MIRAVSIIILAVFLVGIATLLFPIFARDHEGVSRISSETNAIGAALQQYKEKFGTYPTGTIADICKALSGKNKENVIFLDFPQKVIASNGSFLDPWGTPYEIYFSESGPLIRSAGKDHVFAEGYARWSDDYYAW